MVPSTTVTNLKGIVAFRVLDLLLFLLTILRPEILERSWICCNNPEYPRAMLSHRRPLQAVSARESTVSKWILFDLILSLFGWSAPYQGCYQMTQKIPETKNSSRKFSPGYGGMVTRTRWRNRGGGGCSQSHQSIST